MVRNKFTNSNADASLFLKISEKTRVLVLMYVDDIVVTGNDENEITKFIQVGCKEFQCKT